MNNLQNWEERERQDEIAYYAWKVVDEAHRSSTGEGAGCMGKAAMRYEMNVVWPAEREYRVQHEIKRQSDHSQDLLEYGIVFVASMFGCCVLFVIARMILGLGESDMSESAKETFMYAAFAVSGIITIVTYFNRYPGAWKEANKPINLDGPDTP